MTNNKVKYMVKKNQKKAGIEMSLNLIILLIIGMVVLGLVIGFVTKLIGKGTEGLDEQLSASENQQKDQVLSAPGIIAVAPETFNIKSGGSKKFYLKLYNPTNTQMIFTQNLGANFISTRPIDALSSTLSFGMVDGVANVPQNCAFTLTNTPLTLEPSSTQVMIIQIDATKQCPLDYKFFLTIKYTPTGSSETLTLSGTIIK